MKNSPSRKWILIALVVILLMAAGGFFAARRLMNPAPTQFNAERALKDAAAQLAFGPRIPGSDAHTKTVDYIQTELEKAGWSVEIQATDLEGHPIKNIIARRGSGSPWYILGSHYDSRMVADHDPDPARRTQPVPGANDGAATTAILLELARVLPANLEKQVWLVFFDAEDQGDLPGWDWILGSRAFVNGLQARPDGAVIVDMVGDADLQIYMERNSDPFLNQEIWEVAAAAGFSQFIPQGKYSMLDDHTPFLQNHIPAIDLIDFDYPYWHTTQDTLDKISAESLYAVGETLRLWLINP